MTSRIRRATVSEPTAPGPEQDREQSLIEHLTELRSRLLRAVAAVIAAFVLLIPAAGRLYGWLAEPLASRLPNDAQLVAIEVVSPFLTPIKLAFFSALFLAMPIVLYQLWAFVAPGLYQRERRLARPLLAASIVLFYAGCAFAYFLVMPVVFTFLVGITPPGVTMMTDISRYLDFSLTMFFAFGLSFQVPVATILIVASGWMSLQRLRDARPYVIVGAFVIGAIFTPPDVPSQVMLAMSIWLLFELGLLVARLALKPASAPSAMGGTAGKPGDRQP